MSESPLVTVIIPNYNMGPLLRRLLDSILRQTYPREAFEVIIVDNGSKDDSLNVIAEFAAQAPFAVSVFKKNYRGPAASRGFAASKAKGEILAFIDSDCVATPDWLLAGVRAFSDGAGLVQGMTLPNPQQPRQILEKTITVTKEGPYYETTNIFYRKGAFDAVEGFSPEYEEFGYPFFGEDLDLAWKVKGAGFTSAFAKEALVYHEVFKLTPWQWLIEPRNAMTWPYILKKFPHLRQYMFGKYFLYQATAAFDLLVVGLLLATFCHGAFALLGLPYLLVKLWDDKRFDHLPLKLARTLLALPRAVVIFVVLLYGSIKFRSVLL